MMSKKYFNSIYYTDVYCLNLERDEMYFYLYLFLNGHNTSYGIYEYSLKMMAFESRFNEEEIERFLSRFEQDKKIQRVHGYLIINNYLKHQNYNLKIMIGVYNRLLELPIEVLEAILATDQILFGLQKSDKTNNYQSFIEKCRAKINGIDTIPNPIDTIPNDLNQEINHIDTIPNDIKQEINHIDTIPNDIKQEINPIHTIPNDIKQEINDMDRISYSKLVTVNSKQLTENSKTVNSKSENATTTDIKIQNQKIKTILNKFKLYKISGNAQDKIIKDFDPNYDFILDKLNYIENQYSNKPPDEMASLIVGIFEAEKKNMAGKEERL